MRAAAVIGTGQTRHAAVRDDLSVPELAREAARRALEDADIAARDLDAVVIGGGPDVLEGMSGPEHWIAPALGSVGGPAMRVQSAGGGGAAAVTAAFHHVVSGAFDVVLAVSYQKPSEFSRRSPSPRGDPLRGVADIPFAVLGGLQSRRYLDRHSRVASEEHGAMVVVKNRANAVLNPKAHVRRTVSVAEVLESEPVADPLKRMDCSPSSDGAASMVIASGHLAGKMCDRPAWLAGMGASSESRGAPHADPAYPESCVRAAQQAYQSAWVYDPPTELDVAEVLEAFSFQELIWCEALGLCGPGEGARMVAEGTSAIEGSLPVNPSGGALCANPGAATGMVRQVEAAMQVMGRAGDHQVPGARRALAHSWGGALEFNTVTVFASEI